MKLEKAIQILKEYNFWRRTGETKIARPHEIGIAIDTVIDHYELNSGDDVEVITGKYDNLFEGETVTIVSTDSQTNLTCKDAVGNIHYVQRNDIKKHERH